MDDSRSREMMDAPALGASVYLVECSVGELLPLFEVAQKGDTPALMLACLAASLEIDGERVTETQLRNMGAKKWRALMKLGPRALRINSIIEEDEGSDVAEDEDAEKKSTSPDAAPVALDRRARRDAGVSNRAGNAGA